MPSFLRADDGEIVSLMIRQGFGLRVAYVGQAKFVDLLEERTRSTTPDPGGQLQRAMGRALSNEVPGGVDVVLVWND